MNIVHDPAELQQYITRWRQAGERIACVPTMGNLHPGHLALVTAAKSMADRIIVSIFVNPSQFGPQEDYTQYPRTLEQDARHLEVNHVDVVFAPSVATMYPHGALQMTFITVPSLDTLLEGEFRPGHFRGVATIVAKLFHLCTPDVALFGEKDLQQLRVIEHMVQDLNLPVKIVGQATVREPDGLAMSSRNQYLTPIERTHASLLYHHLKQTQENILRNYTQRDEMLALGLQALDAEGFKVQYFTLRHYITLAEATEKDHNLVLLVAAYLGKTRLIDNLRVQRT
jgi:pantoate--beta-alanine ligase